MSHLSLEELTMSLADEEEKDYVTAWRDKIEEWLQEEGWTVGHETVPGVSWVLTARDAQGRPLTLGHPSASKDQIVIQLGLVLDTSLQQQIGQIEATGRRNLIFDLHEAAILLGIQYGEISEPLRRFFFQCVCYFDGLSKNELLGRINRVRDAGVLAMDKINRAVNKPPPPEPARPRLGFDTPS
jgi:hypothetical protein